MLKLLMKYDLRKILKLLVWFYGIAIILAVLTRVINIWSNIQAIQIVGAIFAGLTYSAIATVLINTFIHILLRFSNSFYKDQSYLTHTLPVKKDELILSKYLSSLIVVFLSVLVCFASLFIIFYSPEFMQQLKVSLEKVVTDLNMSSGVFMLLIVLIIFAQICAMMSLAFAAIVRGYSYNHKRGVKGFAWFVVYYISCLLTTLILVVIITAITGDIKTLFAQKMSSGALLTVLFVGLFAYILYAIGFYFKCKKEFKKGVNID